MWSEASRVVSAAPLPPLMGNVNGLAYDASAGDCVFAEDLGSGVADGMPGCCKGGWIQRVSLPQHPAIMIGWLLILCWIFLGVAMGADLFMTSIEMITSKEVTRTVTTRKGTKKTFHIRFWNDTVANLTLMALGSSCPEILLNVLEVCMDNFYAGALGPSTIVGSAAFNLMCITAVCVIALPAGETRTLKNLNVFLITATFSVLAYVWLLVIVVFWTPDVITIVEGVITLVLMFILVLMAYIADTRAQGAGGGYKLKLTDVQTTSGKMDAAAWEAAKDAGLVVKGGEEGAQTAEALAEALQKKFDGGRSRAHYRHQSLMKLPGHGQLSLIFKPATLPRSDTATRRRVIGKECRGAWRLRSRAAMGRRMAARLRHKSLSARH